MERCCSIRNGSGPGGPCMVQARQLLSCLQGCHLFFSSEYARARAMKKARAMTSMNEKRKEQLHTAPGKAGPSPENAP
jgi:hypothetical protein